ncbi:hypothetical protein [Aureivirga sp. CE67]|uniref:hypothetical protein n=1 Tax=Aureivirga sp. CE67 TaxID=1788983 RepID=UPI0018C9BAE5|nr:hypothetical protein [Aureivirga sp. CE67]
MGEIITCFTAKKFIDSSIIQSKIEKCCKKLKFKISKSSNHTYSINPLGTLVFIEFDIYSLDDFYDRSYNLDYGLLFTITTNMRTEDEVDLYFYPLILELVNFFPDVLIDDLTRDDYLRKEGLL